MKGREKVMSLEAELAHHTHQLNDAQAALESQMSQVQVSLWMLCCGWVCCPQPLLPPSLPLRRCRVG